MWNTTDGGIYKYGVKIRHLICDGEKLSGGRRVKGVKESPYSTINGRKQNNKIRFKHIGDNGMGNKNQGCTKFVDELTEWLMIQKVLVYSFTFCTISDYLL